VYKRQISKRNVMAYSLDFRKRAVALVTEEKKRKGYVAKILGIRENTLRKWLKWSREESLERSYPKTRERSRKVDRAALLKHVAEHPDAMHIERAAHFGVSESCIRSILKKEGIARKKRRPPTVNATKKSVPLLRKK
jgi:transposase